MSGIGHAIKKVFKGVVGFVKKYWKPLLIAAAIFFTAGMAAPALMAAGGAEAAGGAAIAGDIGAGLAADVGADVAAGSVAAGLGGGAAAAAGGAGIASGIGAGLAADVGADTAAGVAGLGGADGAAAIGGMETAGGGGLISGGGAGDIIGADMPQVAMPSMDVANIGAGSQIAPIASSSIDAAGGAGTSSLWQRSLNTVGQVMKTPGAMQLISGFAQGAMNANQMDAYLKYQAAHAPGQVAGGVKNSFGGFANNPNVSGTVQNPTAATLPQFAPPQPGGLPMPGQNSPSAESYGMQGYGQPGYGQQTQAGNPANDPYRHMLQNEGLLSQQTPFIESPYDQSYAG